jgi:hypothetical protein
VTGLVFHGRLTYASRPFETVGWSLFDIIGVDHHRNGAFVWTFADPQWTFSDDPALTSAWPPPAW